jgi:transcriptional regulator with XRE-family HTH domain
MDEKQFIKRLGVEIAKQRKRKKLSHLDLSYLCELEKYSLIRIEKGKTNPTAKSLLKISEALNVPLTTFFAFQKKELKKPGK